MAKRGRKPIKALPTRAVFDGEVAGVTKLELPNILEELHYSALQLFKDTQIGNSHNIVARIVSGETLHPKEEDARAILVRINQLREAQGLSQLELEDISQFQQLRYANKVGDKWASRFKRVRARPLKTPPAKGVRQIAVGTPYTTVEQWLLEIFGQSRRVSTLPRALDLLEKALTENGLAEQLDILRKIQATRHNPVGMAEEAGLVSSDTEDVGGSGEDEEATQSAGAIAIETDKFKLSIEGSLPVFGTAPRVEPAQVAEMVKIILEVKSDSLQADLPHPAVELNLPQFEEMTLLMLRALIALRVQYSAKIYPTYKG